LRCVDLAPGQLRGRKISSRSATRVAEFMLIFCIDLARGSIA
jgi:hypothetical protein